MTRYQRFLINMRRLFVTFSSFTVLFVTSSFNNAYSAEIREFYNGVRPLGMGNAFVAVSDDFNAMYYNPAGLHALEEGVLSGFVRGEISADTLDILDAVDPEQSESEIANQLRDLIGERGSFGFDLNASYVRNHFGIGLLVANTQFTYEVQGPLTTPEIRARAITDTSLVGAYTESFFKDRLHVGLSPRFTVRSSIDEQLGPIEIQDEALDTENFAEGYGIDANLGLMYYFPIWSKSLKPKVGVVFKNIFESSYSGDVNVIAEDDGGAKPEPNEFKTDIGFSVTPLDEWGPFSATFALDIKNLGARKGDERYTKHLHYGVELKTEWTSWLGGAFRAGMNQTNLWTAGMTGFIGPFRLDAATYAEELGAYPGQREDRRYAVQMGLLF
jgi:hypothetical protein